MNDIIDSLNEFGDNARDVIDVAGDAVLGVMHSTPFLYAVLVVWAISAVGLVIFVLLHSGKGTGVGEAIAGSIYGTDTGSSIVERNLDRITIVFAVVFMLSLILLMICYPTGSAT